MKAHLHNKPWKDLDSDGIDYNKFTSLPISTSMSVFIEYTNVCDYVPSVQLSTIDPVQPFSRKTEQVTKKLV